MKKMMKRGLAVVLGLSLCVSMMIPVFAEDAKVVTCGKQAHTHTSACYVEGAEPACGLSETEVRESTETVVDEETGETKEVKTYEVVPVHTHGTGCYEAELVCGLKEHTHDDSCYGRTVDTDNVTLPDSFTTETEGGETVEVKVEDGKVMVNGQKVEAEVKTEVTSKPVNTTTGGAGETIKGETTNVYDEEGNLIGTETEYTTTYTTEVTTGYWVTYTVTYTVPTTYSVDEENSSSDVTVELDNGVPTVTGIKDGATVTLKGSDNKEYPVTKETDGKYYVTIGGKKYEVAATVTKDENKDGQYNVSWSFAGDVTDVTYTETVDNPNKLPEGVTIAPDGTVTLAQSVTLKGTKFEVDTEGNIYVMVGEEKCMVTMTATANGDGYTLSWEYKTTTVKPSEEVKTELPETVTVTANGTTLTIKDGNGDNIVDPASKINGANITSIAKDAAGNVTKVTCTDDNGNVFVYAINVTATLNETNGEYAYTVKYQQVESITKQEVNKEAADKALEELGSTTTANGGNQGGFGPGNRPGQGGGSNTTYYEFIAIALPDGSYLEVGRDSDHEWLANGEATNVSVTTSGNTMTISYKNSKGDQQKTYTFDGLEGYDITQVVYNPTSGEVPNTGGAYDYIIINIAGIVVEDKYGNVQTLTLTAKDNGSGNSTIEIKNTVTGNTGTDPADKLGGTTQQSVPVSSLTGSAVVVVKTEGGNQVEMTYSEYLEATAQGKDLELVGVYSSTIEPDDTEGPTVTDPSDPVIPVIPDPVDPAPVVVDEPDIPLAEGPEVEIDESDVPLNDLPEEIEIEEPEIPLAEEAEIELDDPALPLSDIPKTGDISGLWYAAAAVSASGLAATFALKKREDQEDQES